MAKLAVSLADPEDDIREMARETLGQLIGPLLRQQGEFAGQDESSIPSRHLLSGHPPVHHLRGRPPLP